MEKQIVVGDTVTWTVQPSPRSKLIPLGIRGCVVLELVSESVARIRVGARECTALIADLHAE